MRSCSNTIQLPFQHDASLCLQRLRSTYPGIQIMYRTDGGIVNTQRLKAKTKVTKSLVRDLLYADDCAIVAHSEDDLQRLTNSPRLWPISALDSQ